ncbi:MAG: hypothetical protein NT082_05605 [Chloroflexi bacterium]|nr:hypothetical protein [Chloroflexota bacterium]
MQEASALYMTVMPEHAKILQPFPADLRIATAGVAKLKLEDITGYATLYGIMGMLPDRGMAKDFATQFINDLYQVH